MFRILPLIGLFACPTSAPEPAPEDLLTTLPAQGVHGVGFRETELTYDPGDGPRTLRLAIWYPSPTNDGPEFRYQGLFPAPGVLLDTEIAEGTHPLVVYSHGHQGFAEASGRLMAHLASHGYIVASPDHTGNTAFDSSHRPTEIYWQRPMDLGAVIDHMTGPDPLADSLTNDPICAIGHSFGGYTLHAVAGANYATAELFPGCAEGTDSSDFCSTMDSSQELHFEAGLRDPRIAAIFSMAPGDHRLFGVPGLRAVDIPVLLMTGGLDSEEEAELNWQGFDREGNVHVHLSDAGHNAFSDFGPALDQGKQYIDPEQGWATMGAYELAWIRALHGDTSVQPVLDGTLTFGDTTTIEIGG